MDNRALGVGLRVLLPEHPTQALRLLRAAFNVCMTRRGHNDNPTHGKGGKAWQEDSCDDNENVLGKLSFYMFAKEDRHGAIPDRVVYRKLFVRMADLLRSAPLRHQRLRDILEMWLTQYPNMCAKNIAEAFHLLRDLPLFRTGRCSSLVSNTGEEGGMRRCYAIVEEGRGLCVD